MPYQFFQMLKDVQSGLKNSQEPNAGVKIRRLSVVFGAFPTHISFESFALNIYHLTVFKANQLGTVRIQRITYIGVKDFYFTFMTNVYS